MMRKTVSVLLSTLLLSGCFRYQYSAASMEQINAMTELERTSDTAAVCNFALAATNAPAPVTFRAAECLEQDAKRQTEPGKGWFARYQEAARCGSAPAVSRVLQQGSAVPAPVYREGDTGIMLFDDRAAGCGYDREITPVGWIAAPVGIPLYVAGACAAIVLVIPVMAIGVLTGGVN